MKPTGRRHYDRIWSEHVAPALETSREPLTAIVEALPVEVAPLAGRAALYQAMARRAGGRMRTQPTNIPTK
jgi:hypothetical protein